MASGEKIKPLTRGERACYDMPVRPEREDPIVEDDNVTTNKAQCDVIVVKTKKDRMMLRKDSGEKFRCMDPKDSSRTTRWCPRLSFFRPKEADTDSLDYKFGISHGNPNVNTVRRNVRLSDWMKGQEAWIKRWEGIQREEAVKIARRRYREEYSWSFMGMRFNTNPSADDPKFKALLEKEMRRVDAKVNAYRHSLNPKNSTKRALGIIQKSDPDKTAEIRARIEKLGAFIINVDDEFGTNGSIRIYDPLIGTIYEKKISPRMIEKYGLARTVERMLDYIELLREYALSDVEL